MSLSERGAVFVEVYRNRDTLDWIERFTLAMHDSVSSRLDRGEAVVVDGAVANIDTLHGLFDSYVDCVFAYLHPLDLERYKCNLLARFKLATKDFHSGLPQRFWQMVDTAEFKTFCDTQTVTPGLFASIERYAVSSQDESRSRLASIQAAFDNVIVADV